MKIDYSTKRNLEITETMREREKKGSLLWVLDKTKTSMGKRLLRSWLEKPLVNYTQITRRQAAVDELFADNTLLSEIGAALNNVFDIERLMTRVMYESANGKDLNAMRQTMEQLPMLKSQLSTSKCAYLRRLYQGMDLLEDLRELIETAIDPDAPFSVREGGIIRDGFHAELDELHDIERNGKQYIAAMEAKEKERTQIPKLRIGYNRVFGYYIEVTKSYLELVPEDYIRKQTLTSCERFITQELKELES